MGFSTTMGACHAASATPRAQAKQLAEQLGTSDRSLAEARGRVADSEARAAEAAEALAAAQRAVDDVTQQYMAAKRDLVTSSKQVHMGGVQPRGGAQPRGGGKPGGEGCRREREARVGGR
jgi:hypothetical protein